jgi:hypothetical protein
MLISSLIQGQAPVALETMGEVATVTLHTNSFDVDEHYQCPLEAQARPEYSVADVIDSAKKGCPECILRYISVEQNFPDLYGCRKEMSLQGTHKNITAPIIWYPRIVVIAWDDRTTTSPAFRFHQRPTVNTTKYMERMPPFNTSSKQSLETSLQWIKSCDEDHTCLTSTVHKLPRRVLDVRNNRVCLYESGNEVTRYVCLSHCWGTRASSTILRTTLETYDLFKVDIPWAHLPRTFQDAIDFVRRLDVAFLWIDSLCIVQDDSVDWQQQSANMASIYQNAYITLAATVSGDASGGCYTPEILRTNRPRAPLAILKYPDGKERHIFARLQLSHAFLRFPLLQRGWVR